MCPSCKYRNPANRSSSGQNEGWAQKLRRTRIPNNYVKKLVNYPSFFLVWRHTSPSNPARACTCTATQLETGPENEKYIRIHVDVRVENEGTYATSSRCSSSLQVPSCGVAVDESGEESVSSSPVTVLGGRRVVAGDGRPPVRVRRSASMHTVSESNSSRNSK